MKFNRQDIKIIEQAIEHYNNNERSLTIQKMQEIPFFRAEIDWFIMSIIEDLDYADKGITHNRAREYLVQALDWVKKHQGSDLSE